MNRKLALVTLVMLFWSSLAFCGEIHDAARSGDLDKVKALLKANPDLVSTKDNAAMTPLHWAAFMNHTNMVEFLLASKAEVNATSAKGLTPFYLAEMENHLDVAELLRQHGAQDTTILRAALEGNLEKVKAQLKVNSNLVSNQGTAYFGYTPLHAAVEKRYKEVAELLLTNKADVNANVSSGGPPLHLAAARGYTDMVELLLANAAYVNAKDNKGETPLRVAIIDQNTNVADMLRQHGGHE